MPITSRDQLILKSLAEFRLLTTEMICLLFFSHIEPCRRRLRVLLAAELVERYPRLSVNTGRAESIYQLSRQGARLLAQPYVKPVCSFFFQSHSLGTSEVLVRFILAAQQGGFEHRYLTEQSCRQRARSLVPDGCFTLQRQDKRALFYVEYDRGSEGRKQIAAKIHAYEGHMESRSFLAPDDGQYRGFRVLWVTEDEERLNFFVKLAPQPIHWFSTIGEVRSCNALLDPVWRVAGTAEPKALARSNA